MIYIHYQISDIDICCQTKILVSFCVAPHRIKDHGTRPYCTINTKYREKLNFFKNDNLQNHTYSNTY